MKKALIIGAAVLVSPLVIGAADAVVHMAGCNLGNEGACAELARRHEHSAELEKVAEARRAANAVAQAKRDADRKQAEQEEATRFLTVQERATFANRQNIARTCEQNWIRPVLHDPNSFRYLNHSYVMQGDRSVEVRVNYTATNGFGGRVQNTQACTFTF